MSPECRAAEHAAWARVCSPEYIKQAAARIVRENDMTPEERESIRVYRYRRDWVEYLQQEGIIDDVE